MTVTDERLNEVPPIVALAHHEAAHFVGAWRLGRTPAVVSIVAGQTYAGITAGDGVGPLFPDGFELTDFVSTTAPDHRAIIEAQIVVSLAGPLGTHYSRVMSGYSEPDPDDVAAEKAAVGLSRLSPRHRELIDRLGADTEPDPDDETKAADLARVFVGADAEASVYLEWLRIVARRLVLEHWSSITQLAEALLEHRVLSGADAVSTIPSLR